MMRSAWVKWARGVEHARILARSMREFAATRTHDYVRLDNMAEGTNPDVDVQWSLKILEPFPERWSLLLGDVFTNMRAALDHTFWAAAVAHSGPPAQPHLVNFPIAPARRSFDNKVSTLRPLVPLKFWDFVESVQPFHADEPRLVPLEALRWLSNADKHRAVHVMGRVAFDVGPIVVGGDGEPYEIIEEERMTGDLQDGDVVARLKFKRPVGGREVLLKPSFAYSPSLQISDGDGWVLPLHTIMDAMSQNVAAVLGSSSLLLGWDLPEPGSLELGEEHEAVAAEWGDVVATFEDLDGSVQRVTLLRDEPGEKQAD